MPELLTPVLQRVTSDSFNIVLANEASSGSELELANLEDRPARAELIASPKSQCRCEGQEREGRDQGDVVDQGAAIGAVAGFVEEGAGGGDEHEEQEQAVLGDRPGRCQGRRGQPALGTVQRRREENKDSPNGVDESKRTQLPGIDSLSW